MLRPDKPGFGNNPVPGAMLRFSVPRAMLRRFPAPRIHTQINMHLPRPDGHENMRRDTALLALAEQGAQAHRVYEWDGPWVSLGRNQDPAESLLPSCEVPWVMRPTGGQGVLHGHDVTVAIAWPLALMLPAASLRRSVREVYRMIVRPLVLALNDAGIPAALGEDTPFAVHTGRGADCFAQVSANDIVDTRTGQKVCGCALRLTRSAVLLQASIPVKEPLIDPRLVFPDGVALPVARMDLTRLVNAISVPANPLPNLHS